MSFILGLDVGTAAGAAAIKQDGHVQPSELGESSYTVPSVVVLHDDGTSLTGEDAQRVAGLELVRVSRDLRRDPMVQADPIVVGGQLSTPYNMLRALYVGLVERVCQYYNDVPTHVVVTHPALPDGLRCDIVERIADELFPGALLVPEPVAAAVKLACDCALPTSGNIVVYDLGGGTLDLAIVRRDGDRFSLLGEPTGISDFGGIDIDDMVLGHVDASLNGAIANLDLADPVALTTFDRLRTECRQAKEQLSSEAEVSIDASLPENPALVTMRRHELEELLFGRLEAGMDVLEQMVRDAGLQVSDVDAIALVGGSARIPLVPELLRARTRLPVVVDEAPELTAALGAAQMVDEDAAAASVFPIAGVSSEREPIAAGAADGLGGGAGSTTPPAIGLAAHSEPVSAKAPRSDAYAQPQPIGQTTTSDATQTGGIGTGQDDPTTAEPDDEYATMFGEKSSPRIRNALVGGSAALVLAAIVLVGLRNTSSTVRADEGAGGPIDPEMAEPETTEDDRDGPVEDDEDDDEDDDDEDDDNDGQDEEADGTTTTGARDDDDKEGSSLTSTSGASTSSSQAPPQTDAPTTTRPPTTPPDRPTTTTTRPTTSTTTTAPTTTTTTTTSAPPTTDPPGD